jgi:SecD/SecF fusion protein
LATSFCTLLPIIALLTFGGPTLKDFAFALLVGVASGAYSSIFIASPVLTHWKEREPLYRRRRTRIAAEHGGLVPAYALVGAAAQEVAVVERTHTRLTAPSARPDGTVGPAEFSELLRNLHGAPQTSPAEDSDRDPKADARPEDLVLKDDQPRRAQRQRAAKARKGRPR